jgi:hypothetical protein
MVCPLQKTVAANDRKFKLTQPVYAFNYISNDIKLYHINPRNP